MTPRRSSDGPTIDIHCHVMSVDAQEQIRSSFSVENDAVARFSSPATLAVNQALLSRITPKLVEPDVRLRDMDRMGVDIQAISVAPPQFFYWADGDVGARVARIENDNLARIVDGRPDRFVALGTLPLQDVEAAIAELDRIVDELGFRGIEVCTSVNGEDFDDAKFEPLLARLEQRDLFVLMHPSGFWHGERLDDFYLINTVGMPLDSTVAVARMIFGGVLERFPKLKVCVVHGGGYVPFYPARFDHAYHARADCREHITRPPSSFLRQLHFDTMVYDPHDVGLLISRYGAEHVLLGSDYPYDMGAEDPVGVVMAVDGLDEQDRALVLGGNAARLLKVAP